jgi:hypothetical protein
MPYAMRAQVMKPRLSSDGKTLNVRDSPTSLPQVTPFQLFRYCVSFDFLSLPLHLRQFMLPPVRLLRPCASVASVFD